MFSFLSLGLTFQTTSAVNYVGEIDCGPGEGHAVAPKLLTVIYRVRLGLVSVLKHSIKLRNTKSLMATYHRTFMKYVH